MRRRGPYKEYLRDEGKRIPATTIHSRHQREILQGMDALNNERENNGEENVIELHEAIECYGMAEVHYLDEDLNYEEAFSNNDTDDEYIVGEDINDEVIIENVNVTEPILEQDNHNDNGPEPMIEEEVTRPIYPNCPVTKEESDVLVMSYIIRHGVSEAGLEDLISLINCHLPEPLNPSKYLFLKQFPDIAQLLIYYYCTKCISLLNFEGRQSIDCPNCHCRNIKSVLKQNGNFFVYIPMKEQLRQLLSSSVFHKLQRICARNDNKLSDVTSGKMYRSMVENQVISDFDITLQWNADGVDTFKSSKVSMCPIQIAVNELPYRIRKDNILLVGLWCGPTKPVVDIFLKPFVNELQDLHEHGINCLPPNFIQPVNIKIHAILSPVDSVARCSLQNITQFNGNFGCSLCLHPGQNVKMGNGYAHVYCGKEGIARTKEQHYRDAQQAVEQNIPINGVKGVSLLMLLPTFHIAASFPPEYMHAVLLGVVKYFFFLWFDAKYNQSTWYIGRQKLIFNNRLLSIYPPYEFTRTPRAIENMKLYKASEWKNMLLYYSLPCLRGLLPNIYLKHWSLLVFSMHKFLSDEIAEEDFKDAEKALRNFVFEVETLYGKKHMKFNVHLLLHIPKSVKLFGALWAWSAFPFESYNRVLRNMIYNSQFVILQVCKSYLRLQQIKNCTIFRKENCSIQSKKLYNYLVGKMKLCSNRSVSYDGYLRIFGAGKEIRLDLIKITAIQNLMNQNIEHNVYNFERFIYKNILYNTCQYHRMYKRNNSVVKLNNGDFISITHLLCVSTAAGINDIQRYVIIGQFYGLITDTLCETGGVSSSSYSSIARLTNVIVACYPTDISRKCIVIPYNDKHFIIPIVNTVETD